MTGQQLRALALQFQAIAKSILTIGRVNHDVALRLVGQQILNAATDLSTTAIAQALDNLDPHYDAMLLVVRELKTESDNQENFQHIADFADKTLQIASAVLAGNVSGVIASVDQGLKLLQSVRK